MRPNRPAIGVDLGGTHFRLAAYAELADSQQTPTPLRSHRELVGAQRSPEEMVARLAAAITRIVGETGLDDPAIGIGFAGMLRGREGFVANSPHFGWRDVAFGEALVEALGVEVVVENDVNVIAFAEATLGAARGASDVLAVLVGTGIGGGLICDGQLIAGGSGCAGEIGHTKVVLGESARPCHCGKRGCVEAYLGGHNLRDRIRAELAEGARSRAITLAGKAADVEISHIDQAALAGDDYAIALYEEIAPYLGVVLANALTLLNPSHLVLGGGVLSRTPVLKQEILTAMELAINAPALAELQVVDAALGDEAGLIGSAMLALSRSGS